MEMEMEGAVKKPSKPGDCTIKLLSQKSFICKICDIEFPSYVIFNEHRKIHKGEKHHRCDICGRGFAIRSNLLRHVLRHKGEKKYTCKNCDKTFVTDSNLATHMRIHKTRKEYPCSECDNVYLSSHSLNRHMLFHDGKRSYTCSLCGKQFMTSGVLKAHLDTHREDEETVQETKPYMCNVCNKRFKKKHYLQRHERYHYVKPFDCSVCGKGFINNSQLKKHWNSHNRQLAASSRKKVIANEVEVKREEISTKDSYVDNQVTPSVEMKSAREVKVESDVDWEYHEITREEENQPELEPLTVFLKETVEVIVKAESSEHSVSDSESDWAADEGDCDPLA